MPDQINKPEPQFDSQGQAAHRTRPFLRSAAAEGPAIDCAANLCDRDWREVGGFGLMEVFVCSRCGEEEVA